MTVIGLTGQSGAGKGTVASFFARFGVPSVNADDVYRELLVPPSACLDEIVAAFGRGVLLPDGTLDRKSLGAVVFSDRAALDRLNAIAHRRVMAEMRRRADDLRKKGVPAVLLDAPQLFEAGGEKDCDAIVAVLAEEPLRLARVVARDGITEAEARRRFASQYTEAFFREHADFILENNAAPEDLLPRVREILLALGLPATEKTI